MMLLLLIATGSMAFAQLDLGGDKSTKKSDLSAKVPIDKKVKIGKLDNGLTYYIRKKQKHLLQGNRQSTASPAAKAISKRGLLW